MFETIFFSNSDALPFTGDNDLQAGFYSMHKMSRNAQQIEKRKQFQKKALRLAIQGESEKTDALKIHISREAVAAI